MLLGCIRGLVLLFLRAKFTSWVFSQFLGYAVDLAELAAGLEPTLFHRHLLNGIGGLPQSRDPRFVQFSPIFSAQDRPFRKNRVWNLFKRLAAFSHELSSGRDSNPRPSSSSRGLSVPLVLVFDE